MFHTLAGLGFDLQDSTDLSHLHRLNSGMSQSSGICLSLEQQANSKVPQLLKSLPDYTHSSTRAYRSLKLLTPTSFRGSFVSTPPWGDKETHKTLGPRLSRKAVRVTRPLLPRRLCGPNQYSSRC